MRLKYALAALALAACLGSARADGVMPLAAHRAAYQITLAKGVGSQAPVSASGLIAYEFRGSSCEGYAANFRQVTVLQRSEGSPISSDTKAVTFEDGKATTLRFRIDTTMSDNPQEPIDGSAKRSDAGDVSVDLAQPKQELWRWARTSCFQPSTSPASSRPRNRGPGCWRRASSTDRTPVRNSSTR